MTCAGGSLVGGWGGGGGAWREWTAGMDLGRGWDGRSEMDRRRFPFLFLSVFLFL